MWRLIPDPFEEEEEREEGLIVCGFSSLWKAWVSEIPLSILWNGNK